MDQMVRLVESMGFWGWMAIIALGTTGLSTLSMAIRHSSREKTRREIAAYVAEGSITPDQAERILSAKPEGMCENL